jgi:hypothetical protein
MQTLMEIAKNIGGGNDQTGKTWVDLIDKGIEKVIPLIEARQGGPAKMSMLGGPGKVARPQIEDKVNTTETINQGEENNMPLPSTIDVAKMQVSVINASYRLEPPTAPADVIDLLDGSYYMKPEDRAGLLQYKKILENMGLTALSEDGHFVDVEDQAAAQENYRNYFGEIFDKYVDPARKGVFDDAG